MSPAILILTAFREIAAHKFRSALSMLGIVLGVSSLIATMALTAGIEKGTRTFMEQIGGLEYVRVVDKEISNENADFWNFSPGRTIRDAEIIRASVPGVSHISPEMNHGATVTANGRSERFGITGGWPDLYAVGRHEMAAGRFISPLDIERSTKVAVIGSLIREELFPGKTPAEVVGEIILLNNSPFKVVGVLTHYERERDRRARALGKPPQRTRGRWDPFRGKNSSIIIPLSTMFYEFKAGLFPLDGMESVRINNLVIRVANLDRFRDVLEQVRSALMITHRGVDDFDFDTREEWFDNMESSISATRLSGGLIAAISLIVGGIGITNIMLASITERIREIGIRMAVGARGRDIFLQVLMESVAVALLGGLLGIIAGIGLLQILVTVAPSENAPVVEAGSILISVAFAICAGIFSGIYPAFKASRLDPITALRYE
ncbi:MAG: ABC transporter permease [Terrimicrobiaceae bacterium]